MFFKYDVKQHSYIMGTATGFKTMTQVCILMGGNEENKLLQNANVKSLMYHRYLYDVEGIWVATIEELLKLHILANSILGLAYEI